MLQYISACQSAGVARARIASALDVVQKHADDLMTRSRSEMSRARIAKVLVEAEHRSEKLRLYLSRPRRRRRPASCPVRRPAGI